MPFEPADSVRGMLLHTLGRLDEAITCFEHAYFCTRARYAPFQTTNAHRLAAALTDRIAPGEHTRAHDLASHALTLATDMQMRHDINFAQAVLAQLWRTD